MRHLLILTVGICLLLTSVPAMSDQAADEAAIRKARKEMIEAVNKHDAKAMVALVAEINENWLGDRKGRKAYEEQTAEGFKTRWKDLKYKDWEEIGIIFVTSDVAIYKATAEVIGVKDTEGKPLPPIKELEALVYRKIDGKWMEVAYFNRPIEE